MTEKDFVPETFGKWTTLGAPFLKKYKSRKRTVVLCRCECGKETEVCLYSLQKGRSSSCQACAQVTRGWNLGANHPDPVIRRLAHKRYRMIRRCYDPKDVDYPNYGGRGIKVCARWLDPIHGLNNFIEDMGIPSDLNLKIDRINNSEGYSPENCRWATDEEQANNRRNNHPLTYNDVTKNLGQWAKFLGLHQDTLRSRLNSGWSVEKAFTMPISIRHSLAVAAKQKPAEL